MFNNDKELGKRLHNWILDEYGSIGKFLEKSGLSQKEILDCINGVGELIEKTYDQLKTLGCNTAWLRSGFENAIDPVAIPLLSDVYSGDLKDIYSSGLVIGTSYAFPIDIEFHYGIQLFEDNAEIGAKEGDVIVINMTETPVERDAVVIKTKSGQKLIGHLKQIMGNCVKVSSGSNLDLVINGEELVILFPIVQLLHKLKREM